MYSRSWYKLVCRHVICQIYCQDFLPLPILTLISPNLGHTSVFHCSVLLLFFVWNTSLFQINYGVRKLFSMTVYLLCINRNTRRFCRRAGLPPFFETIGSSMDRQKKTHKITFFIYYPSRACSFRRVLVLSSQLKSL